MGPSGRTATLRGGTHRLAVACLVVILAGFTAATLAPAPARGAGGAAGRAAPDGRRYRIDPFSADSWAHYYALIGLGDVDRGPLVEVDREALVTHCATLEDITDLTWIPLGYSIQHGYKLCYRTGPFTWAEARVMCARLKMRVQKLTDAVIVCTRRRAGSGLW